jgi:hypothetical protein
MNLASPQVAPHATHALASLILRARAAAWGRMKDCREGDASFATQPCKLCVAGTRNNRYLRAHADTPHRVKDCR